MTNRLKKWNASIAPTFLTGITARCKHHAGRGPRGIDSASAVIAEENASAATDAVEVSDLTIEPRFSKWHHLLFDVWIAKRVDLVNVDQFAATTSTAAITFVF